MLVTDTTYEGIRRGTTTVLFRKWRSQKYDAGDRIPARDLTLVVDQVTQVPASSITDADAVAAGFADRAGVLGTLEERGQGRDDPDRLVWRVDFHPEDAGC